MKKEAKPIPIDRASAFRLDPTLNSYEVIALRALAGGRTDRQVCKELDMDPTTFLGMMREIREKIGTRDNISLLEWAKQRIKGVDQRIDKPERFARSS